MPDEQDHAPFYNISVGKRVEFNAHFTLPLIKGKRGCKQKESIFNPKYRKTVLI